jgi:hypothetical protein
VLREVAKMVPGRSYLSLERSPIRLDSLNVGRGSGTRLGCRA